MLLKLWDMKKTLFYSTVFLTLIFISGCKKEKPPVGKYVGEFKYDYPNSWGTETVIYEIIESKKDYLIVVRVDYNGNFLDGDTIYKIENKKIDGFLPSNNASIRYQVIGEWEKKFFKKKYVIKGTFTQKDYTQGGPFTYFGTFEIKSN
ncbi:MAG: hypothetical protein OHK0038_26850 [Flammeovirgaceae bacterium]